MTVTNFAFFTPGASVLTRHPEQAKQCEGSRTTDGLNWILRYAYAPLRMTASVLTLSLLLSLNLSTAWAAKCISDGTTTYGGTIEGTTTSCESCGLNCNWELSDGGKLTISAKDNATNVVMRNFDRVSDPNAPNTVTTTDKKISSAPWGKTYANLSQITSVEVGKNITNIGKDAFFYADQITSVTGMEDVITIGQTAFCHAKGLTNIDMPSVETIGMSAFNTAVSLTSIDMPNVTTIGDWAFQSATNLSYVGLPDTNVDIGGYAFQNTAVSNCSISNPAKCNYCTKSNSSSSTPIFQPNATGSGGSCVATCAEGYTVNNGLCKKNSTSTTQVDDELIDDYDLSEGCPEGKIVKGDSCIDASQGCGENYRLSEGICYRIRYTPAEAAQVAGDSNTIFLYYK